MSRRRFSGETSRTSRAGGPRRRLGYAGTAALLGLSLVAAPLSATADPAVPGDRAERVDTAERGDKADKADLDVLYVGAHPDDEASRLSMFGEWRERFGARTGVVTITRGEGGGNAVGPEEGPDLGLLREREERDAVGTAGVDDVYNLDKVDFYYSVSAPLHKQAWGQRDTLGRLVRVIRQTTPEVVMTMNPAPSPGNHGGHQEAALLLIQAYYAAGDPTQFRGQIRREGLKPFAPAKLFTTQVRGTNGAPGPSCATTYEPANPADDIYGVWSGRRAENGRTWAEIEREAQRKYASQGWAGFPDVSADPQQLTCDYMTQIDARVPFVRGDMSDEAAGSSTMLEGAVLKAPGGLPLGTGLDLSTEDFEVVPGKTSRLEVALTAPRKRALRGVRAQLELPAGWAGPSRLSLGTVKPGRTRTRAFEVRAPEDAEVGRALVGLTVRSKKRTGFTDQQLQVVPPVSGTQQLLPQVQQFHRWADRVGVPQLKGTVKPVLTLPSGGTRTVGVDVHNHDDEAHSGEVALDLPEGFSADGPASYETLAPGTSERVQLRVTNDDDTLPTANQGGNAGDYDHVVRTTSQQGESTSAAALELVPTVTLPDGPAPTLDGEVGADEYSAEIDLSRRWEGTDCSSAEDCSATGWITRSGDDLYVAADVTDDTLGTVLDASDCKRHWRVDSLELAFDPTGTSENTSTTFKAAVLPTTTDGVACASRDADNRQGPIGTFEQTEGARARHGKRKCDCASCSSSLSRCESGGLRPAESTAPGFEAVSRLKEPYTGYVIEAKIPMSALPDTVDPDRLGFNAFVYDSDTKDKTGQTRLGWSTFGGVQGDPYRWGRVVLEGDAPPEVETSEPLLDFPALDSLESPPSITQAIRTGVALSGLPHAPRSASAEVVKVVPRDRGPRAVIDAKGSGTAHLFAMYGAEVVGKRVVDLRPGRSRVTIPTSGKPGWRVLMGFDSDKRGTTSSVAVVPVARRTG
jgi:LmbE family N-acetylglucosaminyl deacetylase